MQTHERFEEERLWLARYIYKNEAAAHNNRCTPVGHAIFRAYDKEQVRQKLTAWLRLVLHEEATILSIDLMPPGCLKPLPAQF